VTGSFGYVEGWFSPVDGARPSFPGIVSLRTFRVCRKKWSCLRPCGKNAFSNCLEFAGPPFQPPCRQAVTCWNLKKKPWKRRFLLRIIIFRFHVSFQGSINHLLNGMILQAPSFVPLLGRGLGTTQRIKSKSPCNRVGVFLSSTPTYKPKDQRGNWSAVSRQPAYEIS